MIPITISLSAFNHAQQGVFYSKIAVAEHPWFNDIKKIPIISGILSYVKIVCVKSHTNLKVYCSWDSSICDADYFDTLEHLWSPDVSVHRHGAKVREDKAKMMLPELDPKIFSFFDQ